MYYPEIHKRRSIRLKDYDYASAGAYFVTLCVQNRECLFGSITDLEVELCASGKMINESWKQLPEYYHGVEIDDYVVMPNHFHGIVHIGNCCNDQPDENGGTCLLRGHPQGGAPTLSLPDVVHRFKSLTTTRYQQGVVQHGWQPFYGRLWQRNYYEHIIRSENELKGIRIYITDNPRKWDNDENNPLRLM
jgi:REP element-mobilizing transposase RayT